MNIQLHRKQILILGIAMLLAVVSFWIPMPQRPTPQSAIPERTEPVGGSGSPEAIVYAREPATTWRFSVAERALKSVPIAAGPEEARPDDTAATRLLDPRELVNGDPARLGKKALILPVKNPDQNRNH